MSNRMDACLDTLSELPTEFAKNLREIQGLDNEIQKESLQIDDKIKHFIKFRKSMSKEGLTIIHKEIVSLFEEMERKSEKKVRLASETYELVDKHIRRLDNDSAKLEASMRKKFLDAAEGLSGFREDSGSERKRKGSTSRKEKRRKEESRTVRTPQNEPSTSASVFQRFPETAPVIEMPVDPNEPTYCLCHQVSYGEMVMCDNKQCPIEWFHFQCVGLTETPKGKWYCEKCTEQRRKKERRL